MLASGKSAKQLTTWLSDYRRRVLKPLETGEKRKRPPQHGDFKKWQEKKAKATKANNASGQSSRTRTRTRTPTPTPTRTPTPTPRTRTRPAV